MIWDKVIQSIEEFANQTDALEPGRLLIPNKEIIATAISLAKSLNSYGILPPTRVFPSDNEEIVFEWVDSICRIWWEIVVDKENEARIRWLPL